MSEDEEAQFRVRFPVLIGQTKVGMGTLFEDGRFVIDSFFSEILMRELLQCLRLGFVDGIKIDLNRIPAVPSLPDVTIHDE